MLNVNDFKKRVKTWIDDNPFARENELLEFCKKTIPSSQLKEHQWLLDQTISWYKHILLTRDNSYSNDSK